jgi:hypothetical protein
MVDGVAVAETLAEVVPTEPALVEVVLAKTGALVGTLENLLAHCLFFKLFGNSTSRYCSTLRWRWSLA